jgi:hypothetical protein
VSEQQIPTWSEKRVLQWLVGHGQLATITPTDLVPMYEQRGYNRANAPRIASAALGRLTRKGFMRRAGFGDAALYEITRSGKRAAQ